MGFHSWVIGKSVAGYSGRIVVSKNSLEGLKVTTISIAGVSKTMTVSALLGGMLIYDPTGGVCALTTPTAAEIVAALGKAAVPGTAFKFYLRHAGETTGEDITLTAGSGVTLSPTVQKVAGDEVLSVLVLITNAGANFVSFSITISDAVDADLVAFFAESGALRAAKGAAIAPGDVFRVGGTGDTTDNALATVKGSGVVANDIFIVTSISTPAVSYVSNDSEAVTIYSLGLDLMTT